MEQDIIEETIDNPVEETPAEEIPQKEPKAEEIKPDAELEAKNKELFARAKKAEDELKKLKSQVQTQKSPTGESLTLDAIKVGKRLEKYTEEEIDSVANVIKSDKPADILNALENPFIKRGIEVEREKANSNNKIPSPSSAGFPSFEKKITPDMKPEDINKILEERAKKAQESNSGY
jgi:hypothetical protein